MTKPLFALFVLIAASHIAGPPREWPSTLPVRPGSSLGEIKKALGEPTTERRPNHFDPPVISFLRYCEIGLYLGVHDGLGLFSLEVSGPWSKPIFGIQIGDRESTLQEKVKRDESIVLDLTERPGWRVTASHYPLSHDPAGECSPQKASQASERTAERTVQGFYFEDRERFGRWVIRRQ